MFHKVERETQFAVDPFAIANRSWASVIRESRASDFRAVHFESETGGSLHFVNIEGDDPLTGNRIIAFRRALGFPLVDRPVRMVTFARELPIFENALDDERLVLLELYREAQFVVLPLAITNRTLAGFFSVDSSGDSRALELQVEGCRQSVAVVIERNAPATTNQIYGLASGVAEKRFVMGSQCRAS